MKNGRLFLWPMSSDAVDHGRPRSIRPATRLLLTLALGMCFLLRAPSAPAVEPSLEFVHRLQERGYIDMALYYLDALEGRPDLPALLREVLDLERCNTYLAWAGSTADPQVAEQRFGQARAALDKFHKAHPHDRRAATAWLRWGDVRLDRGQQLLTRAERLEEPAAKTAVAAEARAAFEEACERLGQAAEAFRAWREQLPPGPPDAPAAQRVPFRPRREEVELGAVEAQFKAALARYHLAHTLADSDPARARNLQAAARGFDQLYQSLRNTASETCLYAHLWHARALVELGDVQDARDIFEEVLASEPEEDRADCPQAPLYAQARLFQFQSLTKRLARDRLVQEAVEWLQAHPSWRQLAAYQGLAVEVAKVQMTLAAKAQDEDRSARLRQAAELLAAASRSDSPYRQAALVLQRQLPPESGVPPTDAQKHLTLGDAALAARKLADAEQDFTRALQLATERGAGTLAATAKQRLNWTRYLQAREAYAAGKYEDALAAAGLIAREEASGPSVAPAALLALQSAQALCGATADKDAALARLEKIADYVAKKWSGRPEADQAQLALGRARLQRGETEAAFACLNRVGPDSRQYATALYTIGQADWRAYLRESTKDEASRNAPQMAAALTAARETLQKAAAVCGQRGQGTDADVSLADMQLLLADVLLECRQYGEAVALLEPLVARLRQGGTEPLDAATFRALVATVRAHLAAGAVAPAGEALQLLLQRAEDRARYNELLVNLARLLRQEYDRQTKTLDEAPSRPGARDVAAVQRETLRQLLIKTLPKLVARREYSATDRMHLGGLCAQVGLNDEAIRQFEQGLQGVDAAGGAKDGGRGTVRARAQLVGLLRSQGKFAEALQLSDTLVREYPRYIEPRMTKARLLEDWAAQDPQKYAEAVVEWTAVRTRLGRLAQKPSEYYEAVYHTAWCLRGQWQITPDAAKLLQAEQLLKSTLVLNSTLSGPKMVADYQELLKRIAAEQPQRGP